MNGPSNFVSVRGEKGGNYCRKKAISCSTVNRY